MSRSQLSTNCVLMATRTWQLCNSGRSMNTHYCSGSHNLEACCLPLASMSFWQTCIVRMFVTVSAGSVELGRTTFQLISEREVPQRESFQLVTQVWKLVCSSHLREEFLRSCWIELRNIYFSKLSSRIKRNHLEAKHTGGQHVGGSSPKINPKECACLEAAVR